MVMAGITDIMDADRATLYLVSEDGEELWSQVEQGGEYVEIRLRVGEGIAGFVAQSSEIVNIPDAYSDERFQPRVDLESGYRTRSILCAPMLGSRGQLVGVLQLLNKSGGPFVAEDERLLASLGTQAAVAIETSMLYHRVVAKNRELISAQKVVEQRSREVNVLYETERQLSAAHDLGELLERLTQSAMEIVGAEAGSIALSTKGDSTEDDSSANPLGRRIPGAPGVEPEVEQLRFRTAAGPAAERLKDQSLPIGQGIIGWVAKHRQPLIVNDPASDKRHAMEFASSVGRSPHSIICAPLIADDEVVGAIELLDKRGSDVTGDVTGGAGGPSAKGFSDADLKILTLIAGQASRAIRIARTKQKWVNDNRLAAIGKMLAGVLHDLKTPMTIISGYAQMMAQMDDAEEREAHVAQILHQFEMMNGMTREVLAFARGESKVLVRKVYLHKFLGEVGEQLGQTLAKSDVSFSIEAEYDGIAFFDQQSMFRLIHNLARNASQAMTDGGEFVMRAKNVGKQLVLEFTDNGPGIPAHLEGRLFDLFASGRSGGTGLGLAICKKIATEHSGTIRCQSNSDRGTTFIVSLPLRPKSSVDETGPFVRPG